MATKPKRMMFGGIAKGAANVVKKAVAAKPAPRVAPKPAPRAAPKAAPKPAPRAAPNKNMTTPGSGGIGFPASNTNTGRTVLPGPAPAPNNTLSRLQGGAQPTPGVGATTGFKPGAKASFASSMFGRKKGGVIKKATKK